MGSLKGSDSFINKATMAVTGTSMTAVHLLHRQYKLLLGS